MRPAVLIAVKDLRLMLRDRMAAFFVLAFPLAVAFFFGMIFGGSGKQQALQVAVYVGKEGPAASTFLKAMKQDGAFLVDQVPSREEGEQRVRGKDSVALVVLPEDFDQRAAGMMTGSGPSVELIVDPSRKAEGGLLEGKLAQISFQTMFQRFTDPAQMETMVEQVEKGVAAAGFPKEIQQAFRLSLSQMPQLSRRIEAKEKASEEAGNPMRNWMPISIASSTLESRTEQPTNAFSISFLQGVTWGLFGAVLAFTGSMAEERERGTLLRLLASPISPLQVLLGKAAACFIACVVVETMLITVGVFVCGIPVSSVPLLALATLATAFAFTGIMMVLASIFRTHGGAQGAGRAVLLVLTMIGGGTVPLFLLSGPLQLASNISPFKWAVTAAEGATWRAWSLQMMWPTLGVLALIGAVCVAISTVAMRRRLS